MTSIGDGIREAQEVHIEEHLEKIVVRAPNKGLELTV